MLGKQYTRKRCINIVHFQYYAEQLEELTDF